MDGQNPAPPRRPWNDHFPVNTSKYWLPMVSKWCRILPIHSMVLLFFGIRQTPNLPNHQTVKPPNHQDQGSWFFFVFGGVFLEIDQQESWASLQALNSQIHLVSEGTGVQKLQTTNPRRQYPPIKGYLSHNYEWQVVSTLSIRGRINGRLAGFKLMLDFPGFLSE